MTLRSTVVALPILVSLVVTFWQLNIRAVPQGSSYVLDGAVSYMFDQTWYGPFLKEVRTRETLDGTIIIDNGVPNHGSGGIEHYNPVARFFVEDAERRGERISLTTSGAEVPMDARILTCDPAARRWLTEQKPPSLLFTPTPVACLAASLSSQNALRTSKRSALKCQRLRATGCRSGRRVRKDGGLART